MAHSTHLPGICARDLGSFVRPLDGSNHLRKLALGQRPSKQPYATALSQRDTSNRPRDDEPPDAHKHGRVGHFGFRTGSIVIDPFFFAPSHTGLDGG